MCIFARPDPEACFSASVLIDLLGIERISLAEIALFTLAFEIVIGRFAAF
jgi:hypothetical protein